MKNLFFTYIIIIFYHTPALAQKPSLDTSTFNNWQSVESGDITKNGKYIKYVIKNKIGGPTKLVLKATSSSWQKEYIGNYGLESKFSLNGVYSIIKYSDTLLIIKNGTNEIRIIQGVMNYKMSINEQKQSLGYILKKSPSKLHIKKFDNGEEKIFEDVKDFQFSTLGNTLLLQTVRKDTITLKVFDIKTSENKTIWKGVNISNITFNRNKDEFVFSTVIQQTDSNYFMLYQYKPEYDKAIKIMGNMNSMNTGYELNSILGISMDDNRIFLSYSKKKSSRSVENYKNIEIWNSEEPYYGTGRQVDVGSTNATFCLLVKEQKQFLLQDDQEDLKLFLGNSSDSVAFLTIKTPVKVSDKKPYEKFIDSYYLVSTLDGSRRGSRLEGVSISPTGKFIIGNDNTTHDIISYDVSTAEEFNISKNLLKGPKCPLLKAEYSRNLQLVAWLPDDLSILLSDGYDIWKVSSMGRSLPVNITNGYGYRNKIRLEVLGHQIWDYTFRDRNNKMILKGKSELTKESGFFKANILKSKDPEILTIGAYTFGAFPFNFVRNGQNWSNSKEQRSFIISRESAVDAPNSYLTKDFKHFKAISDVHPQKKYCWLTSDLIKYKQVNGKGGQAIIYKPDNFDSTKSYPVIFYCYEEFSQRLNEFLTPEPCNGGINIPWFVSRDYLVCTPDIYNTEKTPGKTALDAILGIYNRLKTENWVDSSRVAISGHSFGGFETNYIVSHSNVFAAAYSGSGVADMTSLYGTAENDFQHGEMIESGQFGIGGTLWDMKNSYIKNSPIYEIENVQTPILLMSNREDQRVPFAQGLQFFLGLRRLGKKAWLINYRGEGHIIENYQNQLDFTKRLTEFFDYYLKNKPLPEWMRKQNSYGVN